MNMTDKLRYRTDIWQYQPKHNILTTLVGVGKTLLYSSCIQTTRKHNKQDSYLAAMLAYAFS